MTLGHALCTHKKHQFKGKRYFKWKILIILWPEIGFSRMPWQAWFPFPCSPLHQKSLSASHTQGEAGAGRLEEASPLWKRNNSLFYSSFLYKEYISSFIPVVIFLRLIRSPMCLLSILYYHSLLCSLFCCSRRSPFGHWDLFQVGSPSPWWAARLLIIYCLYKIFPSPLFPVSMVNSVFPASFTWDSFWLLLWDKVKKAKVSHNSSIMSLEITSRL